MEWNTGVLEYWTFKDVKNVISNECEKSYKPVSRKWWFKISPAGRNDNLVKLLKTVSRTNVLIV